MLKRYEALNTKNENRITITGGYAMGFPTKFYTENKINSYKYAVLLYDEDFLELGVHFTNDEDEKYKYIIRHDISGRGGSVSIKSLLKTLNIEPKEYKGKYEWEKRMVQGIGETFVIKLEKRTNPLV